jgi:SAM-dependent methyltransferase
MGTGKRFINHYKNGYMPWHHENADFNLVNMVEKWPVHPCRVLEIGCGTGTDAIWLAQNDFDVTAADVSDIAIKMASERAEKAGVKIKFHNIDFWTEGLDEGKFDFVFDRGYFHSHKTDKKRKKFASKVARQLKSGGLWLSLVGSCDSPPRTSGPPMHSATEIVKGVEPYFEILQLKASRFGSDMKVPAKNWVCMFKKRDA